MGGFIGSHLRNMAINVVKICRSKNTTKFNGIFSQKLNPQQMLPGYAPERSSPLSYPPSQTRSWSASRFIIPTLSIRRWVAGKPPLLPDHPTNSVQLVHSFCTRTADYTRDWLEKRKKADTINSTNGRYMIFWNEIAYLPLQAIL